MNSSDAFITGFLLALGLIVSIGPQNAYILRQAALGEGRVIVFVVSLLSDFTLIAIGVLGLGGVLSLYPLLAKASAVIGFIFVGCCAISSFRSFWRTFQIGGEDRSDGEEIRTPPGRWTIAVTTLSLSIFNPQAVLDTVFILGATSGTFASEKHLAFGIGACLASLIWFASLALAGAVFSRFLLSIVGRRWLSCLTCICMLNLGLQLCSQLFAGH